MFVSTIGIRILVSELQRRGISLDDALSGTGLKREDLADMRRRVPLDQADHIVRKALSLTNDPAYGLAVGRNTPEHLLQVLGHLMMSCRTLRQAFNTFSAYSALLVEGTTWELHERGNLASYTYQRPIPLGDTSRVAAEIVMLMARRIAERFVGRTFVLHEVTFEHPMPSYADQYHELFGCPVRFWQAENALVFSRDLLDEPQLYGDDVMVELMEDAAKRLLHETQAQTRLSDRVRVLLHYETDLGAVSLESMAKRLGITPRNLRGRLATEGGSITTLLDEARFARACEELSRPNACIKAMSDRLGFSEPSAFHRAFKRWTGKTPLEYARAEAHAS